MVAAHKIITPIVTCTKWTISNVDEIFVSKIQWARSVQLKRAS